MINWRLAWLVLASLFLFQTAALSSEIASNKAVQVIESFQSVLLSTMKDAQKLGFEGRYMRLQPAIKQSFYLSRIARLTIGKHWQGLEKQQKHRFVDVFTRLVIATYAHQFDGYTGESFSIESVQEMKRGRVFIRTLLVKANGKVVHLDYVLQDRKGRWLIVNIISNGVSDLALKRVEYSSVLKRQGFDALLSKLEGKILQYK